MHSSQSQPSRAPADPVGALLVDCMEKLAGGDHGAIEQLCATHPEHAAEIRERMGVLLQMGLVEGAAQSSDEFPELLGEFQLLRRLGGGGMGVVYEAKQQKLGRTVALKLIRPEHLYFPRARERFRRETESVARLQHPSIVSIYTVGEERGIPFFAMELIRGATLADVLTMVEPRAPESLRGDDFRMAVLGGAAFEQQSETDEAVALFDASWTDACVRIALRIAEALTHAHARGVLHRDIKPSNITVTPEGRVVLLDFGLASTSIDVRMTTYGTAVGSVLYMAPEQIDGHVDEIGPRTDVYSLGVTLCELLTLQVPYTGRNAQEVKTAIASATAPQLRTRNPRISRDLETVCLKAIEGERGRRYASMADFAADLQHILAGEPVAARPPSSFSRALRWIARHPTGTTAALLAAVLVIVVPTVLYFQQRDYGRQLQTLLDSEKSARTNADLARKSADDQRERAELEARDSEAVTKFLVDIFGAADRRRTSSGPPTAEDLLRTGVERIDTELGDQPQVRARLLERMSESFSGLGSYDRARSLAERALTLRRELHGDDDVRTARALVLLGIARRLGGMSDQGIAQLTEGIATYACLLGPSSQEALLAKLQLSAAHVSIDQPNVARKLLDEVRADAALQPGVEAALRPNILSAVAYLEMITQEWPQLEATCLELLQIHDARGGQTTDRLLTMGFYVSALRGQNRWSEARALAEECVERARSVYGDGSVKNAEYLAALGEVAELQGDWDGAARALRSAHELNFRLHGATHPSTFRSSLRLAGVFTRMGESDQAVHLIDEHRRTVVEELGASHVRAAYLALQSADLRLRVGRFEEARELVESLQTSSLVRDARTRPALVGTLALCAWMLGDPEQAYDIAYNESGPSPTNEWLALVIAGIHAHRGETSTAIDVLENYMFTPVDRFTEKWVHLACGALLATLRKDESEIAAANAVKAREAFEREFGTNHAVFRALLALE